VQDLDLAVARELVFSLWIRRRDTHSYNRAYLIDSNLYVFFDHQTAFLGEPELSDIQVFLDAKKLRAGHANAWAVKEIGCQELSTDFVREYETSNRPLSIHFVNDFLNFERCVEESISFIRTYEWDYKRAARKAGFCSKETAEIIQFLKKNMADLPGDCEEMMRIVRENSKKHVF
jgi:hypothetical protein